MPTVGRCALLVVALALTVGACVDQTHAHLDAARAFAAKGEWARDQEVKGDLKTGVLAIGGETTGVELGTADHQMFELDLHGDEALTKAAGDLNGKPAVVTGYVVTKAGVEVRERHLLVVVSLKPTAK